MARRRRSSLTRPCSRIASGGGLTSTIHFKVEQIMSNVAVVTGAGSGVGRAVVIKLAKAGWRVALVGRRIEPLEETMLAAQSPNQHVAVPCDVSDESAVREMAARVIEKLGVP